MGNADGNELIDNLVLHMINMATWQGREETTVSWSALVSAVAAAAVLGLFAFCGVRSYASIHWFSELLNLGRCLLYKNAICVSVHRSS